MELAHRLLLILVAAGLLTPAARSAVSESDTVNYSRRIHYDALQATVNLLRVIASENPDYAIFQDSVRALPRADHDRAITERVERNRSNQLISQAVDRLVRTGSFAAYYQMAPALTPEIHREVFVNLPYRTIAAQGGIAEAYFELLPHTEALGLIIDSLPSKFDIRSAQQLAERWVPSGKHNVPEIYLVMEGNLDAKAQSGVICFDLVAMLFSKRSLATRFDPILTAGETDRLNRTLAHELQHIYYGPTIRAGLGTPASAFEATINEMIRTILMEGTAMQCNPPEALRGMAMRDTTIILAWIEILNTQIARIRSGAMGREEARAWMWGAADDSALAMMDRFLVRDDAARAAAEGIRNFWPHRPSWNYTLGWWIISHLTENGRQPENVLPLMNSPYELILAYNQSVTALDSAFVLKFR